VTQAAKAIAADRKLVLSGTPLQNKVSELWSIFDFLMPNFLETEKVFNQKYNQFLTSNLNKLSEKLEETEKFIHALKSLKKRVAPFVLRRTKNEVLKDLPPKVIQDFECEMPRLQQEVHDFIERQYPISQMV
jgi:TATA-binding protein-associated factor